MVSTYTHPPAQWIGRLPTAVFLMFALTLGSFLSVSKEAHAQTVVTYGQEYYIKNSYAEGSYLDTCGGATCSATTRFAVVTDSQPDRAGVGTGKWVLLSATGKANGSNVLFGDVVHIRNMYAEGSYLDTCAGASCSATSRFGVMTDSQPDRAGVGTGKWTIVSAAGKANGSNVLDADVVHLRNMYAEGSYLDTCDGATCTATTRFSVMTDSQPDRAKVGTGTWSFVPVLSSLTGGVDPEPGPGANAIRVTENTPMYIRVQGGGYLYLHANGGSVIGAPETLYTCPEVNGIAHPNCQWIFEPSTTRPGAYYIRVSNASLYLHANLGSKIGAQMTLHPCSRGNDYPNCQWYVEDSPTRPGAYYFRVSDAPLNMHANLGSKVGAQMTLHPCARGDDYENCQWSLQPEGTQSTAAATAPWNPVGNPAQSSTAVGGVASRAWDNNLDGNYQSSTVTHTGEGDPHPWWYVDLGKSEFIMSIYIGNRTDCCSERLSGAKLFVSDVPFKTADPFATEQDKDVWTLTLGNATGWPGDEINVGRTGRYIRVQLPSPGYLSLAEVAVKTKENPCRGRPLVHVGSGYNGCEWRPTDVLPDGVLVSISHNAFERGVQRYSINRAKAGIDWHNNLERRGANRWYAYNNQQDGSGNSLGSRASHSINSVFRVVGHAENPLYVRLSPVALEVSQALQAVRDDFSYRSVCYQSDLSNSAPSTKQIKAFGVVNYRLVDPTSGSTFFRAMPNGRMDILNLSPWVHAPLVPFEMNEDICERGDVGGNCGTGFGSRGECSSIASRWRGQQINAPLHKRPDILVFQRYADWDDTQTQRAYSGWADGIHQFFLLTPQ